MLSLRPLVRLAAVAAIALTACGDSFQHPAAVVDGVAISDDTVRDAIPSAKLLTALVRTTCGAPQPGEPGRGPCVRYTLGYLIERQLVNEYAREHDIAVERAEVQQAVGALRQRFGQEQIDAILRQFGVKRSEFESLVRQQLLLTRVQTAVGQAAVGEREIRAAYERERSNFTLVHMALIQLASQEEAQQIGDEATPENFAELARKHSLDTTSAARGGDLGSIPAGRLPAELLQAALALEPGEISDPIESVGRWNVIRLIDVKTQPYEEVRDQLRSELAAPAYQQWYLRHVRDGVEVNPRFGRLDPRSGEIIPLTTTATALPSPTPVRP